MEMDMRFTFCLAVCVFMVSTVEATNVDNFLVELAANDIRYEWVTFTNWGSTVTKSQVIMVWPLTKDEVILTVRFAKDNQGSIALRIRSIGSTHAFSDLFADEQSVLLNMTTYDLDGPDRLYIIDSSDNTRPYYSVSFNPSVSTQELLDFMAVNGISLPSFPANFQPSLIGSVAAGGHGMNWQDSAIGSNIESLLLITGQGDFRQFNILQHGDLFNVFRSHLGLCGVIIQLTLKVVSHQLMSRYYDARFPMSQVFTNMTAMTSLLSDHHSWLATWDIFSSLSTSEIAAMATDGGITSDWDPQNDYLENILLKELDEATQSIVEATENRTEFSSSVSVNGNSYNASLRYSYYPAMDALEVLANNEYPVHCEFAFSVSRNTFSQVPSIIQIIQTDVKAYATSHSTLPLKNIQFSFMLHDNTCFFCHTSVANSTVNSNAASGNQVFIVNFQFYAQDVDEFNTLIETIYSDLKASNYQGLPHWGKYIPDVTTIKDDLVTMMKTRIDDFNELRAEGHLDDIDLFTNNFIDTIVFVDKDRVVRAGGSSGSGSEASRIQSTITESAVLALLLLTYYLT